MQYTLIKQMVSADGRTNSLEKTEDLLPEVIAQRISKMHTNLAKWGYDITVTNEATYGGVMGSKNGNTIHMYSTPAIRLDDSDHDFGEREFPTSAHSGGAKTLPEPASQLTDGKPVTSKLAFPVRRAVGPDGTLAMQVSRGMEPAPSLVTETVLKPHSGRRHPLHDGTYTVEFQDKTWRTYRVQTQDMNSNFAPGQTVLSFLSGPDNASRGGNWVQFAFFEHDTMTYRVWQRMKSGTEKMQKIELGLRVLLQDPAISATAYAMRSGRCSRCGRKITTPQSVKDGLGPECARKVGLCD